MIEQGSVEWFLQRCGKVTASRMSDMLARTKSGWGAGRANYLAELVAERLTGIPAVGYQSAAMQWGSDTEPQARAAYEFFRDATVELAEFVDHPSIAFTGASPDGYVGTDGLVEIKCPNTATHIGQLLAPPGSPVDRKYWLQTQWQMACTGRKWCDLVSFDPRLPGEMQLYVTRVPREDDEIRVLEAEVISFLEEVSTTVASLSARYGAKAA